jgi:RNA polymerase sigma-70 factor, ECF subfamily
MLMEDNDEELIIKYLEGDQQAFKALVEKYTSHLYNFARRFVGANTASDIVQESFIKVWKNIKKFDASRAHFKTWVFAIARNIIIDYLRKKKSIVFSDLDNDEEVSFSETVPDNAILPDEVLQQLEDKEFLNKLLDQILPMYREVLILYYQEEMTFAEIGEMLDKPLNTVKSYHYRALKHLKKMTDDIK